MLTNYGFDEQSLSVVTLEACIDKCKTNMFTYAALLKGKKYVTLHLIIILTSAVTCKTRPTNFLGISLTLVTSFP